MYLPFYLSNSFSVNRSNHHITSENYLLDHTEQALSHRKMNFERAEGNKLFYRQHFLKSLNSNDVIRTLEITVDGGIHTISFKLKTDFIKEILFTLFFIPAFYLGLSHLPLWVKIVTPLSPLVMGLIFKTVKLWRIKKDLIRYFSQLKN